MYWLGQVDAFPSPVVRWFHVTDLISNRVVEISNNEKHEIEAAAHANDETHTSLTIRFGSYLPTIKIKRWRVRAGFSLTEYLACQEMHDQF